MRMPKCAGIPERAEVEVIDEHQFVAKIADARVLHARVRMILTSDPR